MISSAFIVVKRQNCHQKERLKQIRVMSGEREKPPYASDERGKKRINWMKRHVFHTKKITGIGEMIVRRASNNCAHRARPKYERQEL